MALSTNIKCFREDHNLTQEVVADLLSKHQTTYSRIEQDNRRCEKMLPQIAEALGTTPTELRNYHLIRERATELDTLSSTAQTSADKDAIIQNQATELTFLKRHLQYMQSVLNQFGIAEEK